uniref:Kelch domain-containing protein 10 n=1 Tax=Trichuris muris TaxID=70415 RepID=A0A5S6Q3J5_TRIMR
MNTDLWNERAGQTAWLPVLNEIWKLNLLTNEWTRMKPFGEWPTHLVSHSMLLKENVILLFGGGTIPFSYNTSNDLHVLSLNTLTWRRLNCIGTIPTPRYGHAMAIVNGVLYMCGGTDGHEFSMDVYSLPLRSGKLEWTRHETERNITGRYQLAIIPFQNTLIMLGGSNNNQIFGMEEIDAYNISSRVWERLHMLGDNANGYPQSRKYHAVAVVGSVAYMCGGCSDSVVYDDIWALNMGTRKWKKFSISLPHPLFFHACSVTPTGCLVIYGGILSLNDGKRNADVFKVWVKPQPLKVAAIEALQKRFPNMRYLPATLLRLLNIPEEMINWLQDRVI